MLKPCAQPWKALLGPHCGVGLRMVPSASSTVRRTQNRCRALQREPPISDIFFDLFWFLPIHTLKPQRNPPPFLTTLTEKEFLAPLFFSERSQRPSPSADPQSPPIPESVASRKHMHEL